MGSFFVDNRLFYMARLTVNQIMQSIAATVNQEATAPTAGGAEYTLWLAYINRAYQEWGESHDWEVLKKTFWPGVTGVSTATVSLPLDYRKLAAAPRLHREDMSQIEGEEFADIQEETMGLYNKNDKFVYQIGDMSSGFSLIFHPGTLSSGASVEIPYFSVPTSLASPAEVPLVTDPQFLVDRAIGYIFEARSDPRFQQSETKAREKLLQMVEGQNDSKYTSYGSPQYVSTAPLRKAGFRMGRD